MNKLTKNGLGLDFKDCDSSLKGQDNNEVKHTAGRKLNMKTHMLCLQDRKHSNRASVKIV